MSGHSEFAPIGNNPVVRMPPAGSVGDNAGQPENVPQIQPQAQPENAQADQPDARSLLQKLDTMLLKAAEMSTRPSTMPSSSPPNTRWSETATSKDRRCRSGCSSPRSTPRTP